MERTLLLLYSYNNSVSRHWDYCCLTHDWPYYLIFRHSGSGCTMKRTLCCYLVTTLLLYNYSIPRSDVRTIVEQPMTDFIAWFLVNRSLAAQCTLVETLLWNKSIRLHDVRIVVVRPPKSESKRSQTVKRKEHSKSFAQKIVSTFSRPRGRKEKEESEKFFRRLAIWQNVDDDENRFKWQQTTWRWPEMAKLRQDQSDMDPFVQVMIGDVSWILMRHVWSR